MNKDIFSKENLQIEIEPIIPHGKVIGLVSVQAGIVQLQYKILSNEGKPAFAVPASTPLPKGGFKPAFSMPKEYDTTIRKEIMHEWNNRSLV